MKTFSEKSMIILATLSLGLIIGWLIVTDKSASLSPPLLSAEPGISMTAEPVAH